MVKFIDFYHCFTVQYCTCYCYAYKAVVIKLADDSAVTWLTRRETQSLTDVKAPHAATISSNRRPSTNKSRN